MLKRTLSLLSLVCLCSCGTMAHGTRQAVVITSEPSRAEVFVDESYMGKTPLKVKLTRRHNHTVRTELAGHQPYQVCVNRQLSGWSVGNLAFGSPLAASWMAVNPFSSSRAEGVQALGILVLGSLPGMAIDYLTGGLYKLDRSTIHAPLLPAAST